MKHISLVSVFLLACSSATYVYPNPNSTENGVDGGSKSDDSGDPTISGKDVSQTDSSTTNTDTGSPVNTPDSSTTPDTTPDTGVGNAPDAGSSCVRQSNLDYQCGGAGPKNYLCSTSMPPGQGCNLYEHSVNGYVYCCP